MDSGWSTKSPGRLNEIGIGGPRPRKHGSILFDSHTMANSTRNTPNGNGIRKMRVLRPVRTPGCGTERHKRGYIMAVVRCEQCGCPRGKKGNVYSPVPRYPISHPNSGLVQL